MLPDSVEELRRSHLLRLQTSLLPLEQRHRLHEDVARGAFPIAVRIERCAELCWI
jgi:hypothetical protein